MQYLSFNSLKKDSSKGFTLVELLVVVTLITVLTSLGLSTYIGIQARGRDAKRRADVDEIRKTMELFYNGKETQPYQTPQGSWFQDTRVPTDPRSENSYTMLGDSNTNNLLYTSPSRFTTYVVCAKLENKGGNSRDTLGAPASTPATDGLYYCRKNIQ